jgi:pimeloyl-ACP methyl ester carboxylesterase
MTTPTKPPVVFVHGLWLHSSSWQAWVDKFAAAGYPASAADWPGDGATVEASRNNPKAIAGHGVNDVVAAYADYIATLPAKPIVIGHSFGGLIAQRLLGDGHAVAGVAIDPAPIKGVVNLPPSALRVASIALRNPLNRGRAVSLTRAQFRYGFGNALSETESDELFEKWAVPSPGKPLFEAAFAAFSPNSPVAAKTKNNDRGPLLITAGGKDHTVPASVSRTTKKLYRHSSAVTDLIEFADRGHSLSVDSGWETVADASLEWLAKQGL